ncbi:MAG: twin-arginine translocase TatA/TatE family subunit [Thermodesulfobacteriota bacterium]
MIGGLGVWELVIILVILLLIFGPSRLGDLGSALGKGIKGFRKSLKEPDEIDITPPKEDNRVKESEFQTPKKPTDTK